MSERAKYESRRRAFQRGSNIIYLHREKLTTFVTLTFKNQTDDYMKVKTALNEAFSRRGISYLAVIEKHKSGMLHIHALTSDLPNVVSLKKGKYSWKSWRRGFSDVKFVKDTDEKFRIEQYIFKYMKKSEKIGRQWYLKSQDLTLREEDPRFVVRELERLLHIRQYKLERFIKNLYSINGYDIPVEKEFYARQVLTQKCQDFRALRFQGQLRGSRLLPSRC